jgi:lipoprotein-releasing system permease protein
MIVLEKRKDIAVLMTMGASPSRVASIFRIQGAVIGLVGTVLGLGLSVLGCVALQTYGFPLNEQVFQMKQLPVRIEIGNFIMVSVSAFAICFLSTFYPARRASQLEPAEVLRYE